MIICQCNAVTAAEIAAAALVDPDVYEVSRRTGACRGCGSCASEVLRVIDETTRVDTSQPDGLR